MGKRLGLPVAFGKLSGLKGGSERQSTGKSRKKPSPVDGNFTIELIDERVKEVLDRLPGSPEDLRTAQRVVELEGEYPQATIPELIFYEWLEKQEITFYYQAYLFGGRTKGGGLLPDFLIDQNGEGLAIQIYGIYWHSDPVKVGQDAIDRMRMIGQQFNGLTIKEVVVIWENNMFYQQRNTVFEDAINGIERPQ